jgi:hypothetical protein
MTGTRPRRSCVLRRLRPRRPARLDPDEKRMVRELLDSILLKHDAKRWTRSA